MTRYQGEDIEFSLSLKVLEESDMHSWYDATSVVAYFYTDVSQPAKYTTDDGKVQYSGYRRLNYHDQATLLGVIPSAVTKYMNGPLYCDIYVDMGNGAQEYIKRAMTGINIVYTPIKEETV